MLVIYREKSECVRDTHREREREKKSERKQTSKRKYKVITTLEIFIDKQKVKDVQIKANKFAIARVQEQRRRRGKRNNRATD